MHVLVAPVYVKDRLTPTARHQLQQSSDAGFTAVWWVRQLLPACAGSSKPLLLGFWANAMSVSHGTHCMGTMSCVSLCADYSVVAGCYPGSPMQ